MTGLSDLLADNLFIGLERQSVLGAAVGDRSWSVDVPAGVVRFEGGPTYAMDVVGSEDADQGTWLWAWANSNLPPGAGAASTRIRTYGEQHGVPELATPSLPLGQPPAGVDGHLLGLVSTQLLGSDAYYLGHTGALAVLMVVRGPDLALRRLTGPDFRQTMTAGLGLYGVDHRRGLRTYLHQRRATLVEQGDRWEVTTSDGQVTTLSFDALGRVASTTMVLQPEPARRRRLFGLLPDR